MWDKYIHESIMQISDSQFSTLSAAQLFEKYLDYFIDLYKNHADLLRFNQLFNIYVRGEDASEEQLAPYLEMIRSAAGSFHQVYSKAENDGTVRTDISEEEMFTSAIHLMLAAATRYAVGLVYTPKNGAGEENELRLLKELLLMKYVVKKD